MVYDFDTEIDRMHTSAVKWSFMKQITGLDDLFPLWVADMDFACAPEIVNALSERITHPIYGYTGPTEGYHQGLINWMDKRHDWKGVEKEWVVYTPGVVAGFSLAIQAYSQPGDKIVIQPPVYYPFKNQILANGRQVVTNPLKVVDGQYRMDFEDLENKIDDRTRMIILCSPTQPNWQGVEKRRAKETSQDLYRERHHYCLRRDPQRSYLWGYKTYTNRYNF